VAKAIVEQIADQVFTQLATVRSDFTSAFGRRELEKNAGAMRVVCVPIGAPTIMDANRPGDGMFTDVGRILYVRQFEYEWHCHGVRADGDVNDFGSTELLYLDTLRAVRFVGHAPLMFSGERWIDQELGADSLERFGSVIAFNSVIGVPIYEARGGTKALTGVPPFVTTGELNGEQET